MIMDKLNDLIDLAKKIKNKDLREKVIELLNHPSLQNKALQYSPASLERAPASINWHHVKEGGLIEHTRAVTLMCISIGNILEKVYGMKIDFDSLIAGALLHDIGKLWNFKKKKSGWDSTDLTLDHTTLGTAELYARGFPESVLHIVASHFGEHGPTPPKTVEALILHTVDTLDAILNEAPEQNIINLILTQD